MKLLVIEDDLMKSKQIAEYLRQTIPELTLHETRSFQSGLSTLVGTSWDAVVLDMTLPTYDVKSGEDGGRIRTFGGIDILDEISRRALSINVIVVTQFPTFGEGPEKKTLDELDKELTREYPDVYQGTVYYHPSQTDWKGSLRTLLMPSK